MNDIKEACEDTPIQHVKEEELVKTLAYVMTLLGIKPDNFPKDLERKVLIDYCYKSLNTCTCKKIKLAFVVGLRGDLDININEHFGVFSASYLHKVIKSFSIWMQKNIQKNIEEQDRKYLQSQLKRPPQTKEQYKEECKKNYTDLISYIEKNNKLPLTWPYETAFIYARDNGIITDSKEELEMFMENILFEKREELQKNKTNLSVKDFKKELEHLESNIKNVCRKERLVLFLKAKYNL